MCGCVGGVCADTLWIEGYIMGLFCSFSDTVRRDFQNNMPHDYVSRAFLAISHLNALIMTPYRQYYNHTIFVTT